MDFLFILTPGGLGPGLSLPGLCHTLPSDVRDMGTRSRVTIRDS